MNDKWDIGDVLSRAWNITKDNLGIAVGSTVVYFVVLMGAYFVWYGALAGILFGFGGDTIGLVLLAVVGVLGLIAYFYVTAYLTVGYLRLFFKLARGEGARFGDLFSGGAGSFSAFVAMIVISIVSSFGLMFLVVPGFLVGVMWFFSMFLIADKKMGPFQCLGESWNMVKPRFMDVLIWFFVFAGIQMLGQFAMGVGIFVAMPVGMIGTVMVYDTIIGGLSASTGAPAPGMPAPDRSAQY